MKIKLNECLKKELDKKAGDTDDWDDDYWVKLVDEADEQEIKNIDARHERELRSACSSRSLEDEVLPPSSQLAPNVDTFVSQPSASMSAPKAEVSSSISSAPTLSLSSASSLTTSGDQSKEKL